MLRRDRRVQNTVVGILLYSFFFLHRNIFSCPKKKHGHTESCPGGCGKDEEKDGRSEDHFF
jgi:hypothetical protein